MLGVELPVRIAIASHEALQPQSVASVSRPNQNHPSLRMPYEPDPPQDEGPHQNLANVGLARDQVPEIGTLDADHAAVGPGTARDKDLTVVEQVHLSGELARLVDRQDGRLSMIFRVENFDRTIEHQEEVPAALAALEDDVACLQ